MSALQKVNLGTAPAGTDGDAVRTAFIKDNANVDVLNSQTFLTSVTPITTALALTTAHIGKRVNINLGSPGTINLPSASTCAADQVILLRNLGSTVVTLAITVGSGDTVSISKINPGETALMDTDGTHTWTCLMRGRTNSDNETVNGNCAVNGNETVGGTLTVTGSTALSNASASGTLGVAGLATLTGGVAIGSSAQVTISAAGAYSGTSAAYSGQASAIGGFSVPNNTGYRATSTNGTAVSVLFIDASNNVVLGNGTISTVITGTSIKDGGGNPLLTTQTGAAIAGSAALPFNVGTASVAAHAVRFDQAYGVGQTLQDVSPSRAYNTTFTNSTGKGIYVYIQGTTPSGGGAYGLFISGQEVALASLAGVGAPLCVSAFVPPGATYQLSTSGSVSGTVLWKEYR